MRKPSEPALRMKYDLPSRTSAALSIDVVSSSGCPSAKRSSGRCATLSVCPPDDSKRIAVPTRRWISRSGPLVSASSALLWACSLAMSVSIAATRRDSPSYDVREMMHAFNLTSARLASEIDKGLAAVRGIVLHKTNAKGKAYEELVYVPEWPARLGYARQLKELVVHDKALMGINTFVLACNPAEAGGRGQ